MADFLMIDTEACRDNPEVCRNHAKGIVVALGRGDEAMREVANLKKEVTKLQDDVTEIKDDVKKIVQSLPVLQTAVEEAQKWQTTHDELQREDVKDKRTRRRQIIDWFAQPTVAALVAAVLSLLVVGVGIVSVREQVSEIKAQLSGHSEK